MKSKMSLVVHFLQIVLLATCTKSTIVPLVLSGINAVKRERDLLEQQRVIMRQQSTFIDTVQVMELPSQPDGMIQVGLSMIVVQDNFTLDLNSNVIRCLANHTGSDESNWGVYRIDRFAPGLLQADYFTLIDIESSKTFAQLADRYIQDGLLSECAMEDSSSGQIISGRASIELRVGEITTAGAGGPTWIVAALIGALCLIGVVLVLVITLKGREGWTTEDYPDSVQVAGDVEVDDAAESIESDEIAGRQDLSIVAL